MKQLRKPFQHTQSLVIKEVREQIQEDVRTCMEGMWSYDEKHLIEDMLCQIVVDNFKRLEDK